MTQKDLRKAQAAASEAARQVGALLRRHLHRPKRANETTQHDIKLELDVRSQKLIQTALHAEFPEVALLGEEGVSGDPQATCRWVVDPIDGTVNFAYGVPHACVSIALQERAARPSMADYEDGYNTLVGVVYDPFCDELWTAIRRQPASLNGARIHVSTRTKLSEAIISIGFAKTRENLETTLPCFNHLIHQVRKLRIMGSAALDLAYVASGRFDAYIEGGLRLWDIAAGGLIVQSAGGRFWHEAIPGAHAYRLICSNAVIHRFLQMS